MKSIHKISIFALIGGALGCNIVDPDANPDGGSWVIIEDAGGGDGGGGGDDTGNPEDTGTPVDAGDCAASERNECGGCTPLGAKVGDPCGFVECGAIACIDANTLGCDCLQRDGCFQTADQSACECVQGYEANGTTTCADIDECAQSVCDPLTDCSNTVGGFTCTPCPQGTIDVNGNGTLCQAPFEEVEAVELSGNHPGNTSECIQVNCPGEKIALSGGFTNDPAIRVDVSRRASGGRSWLVCGFSPDSAPWTAHAICAKANVEVTEVDVTHTITESACPTTQCPDGTKVLGGGGSWGAFRADHNRPDFAGRGWTFCGLPGTDSDEISVTAICADVTSEVIEKRVPSGTFSTGCVQQECRDNEVLVGGGVYWGFSRTLTKNAPSPATDNEWQHCSEASTPEEAWVSAICVVSP